MQYSYCISLCKFYVSCRGDTRKPHGCPLSHPSFSMDVSFHWWLLPEKISTAVLALWSSTSVFPSAFTNWTCIIRTNCYLYIQLLICIILTHGYLFYSLNYNPSLSLITLLLKLPQLGPLGAFSGWPLGPLDMSSLFFSPSFLSSIKDILGSWSQPFL